ncbi:MAG: BREX system P-loop protein BrxC [Spirochaetaceae bacterium]|nr:MAG: BREX system P-loop protein BrxC [Spirochaetaceae bacterium]
MSTLKGILKRDITREIEGVIKADDDRRIRQEIEEYVVTAEIQKRLQTVFSGIKEAISRSISGGERYPYNGVWISGYFGSGKSHLLKILAHLMNSDADAALRKEFLSKIEDSILRADVDSAFAVPTRSILFNIDQLANSAADDSNVILEVFQKVFDRMLGYYDENATVAELERDLDKRGDLARFAEFYHNRTGRPWVEARSDVMFLERDTFVEVFSEFHQTGIEEADKLLDRYEQQRVLTAESFARRIKQWLDSQEKPNQRINFFVDEVGQFVGNSRRRMLNLQTVAETLATVCDNRAWVFVTSQEDLDSVIGDAALQQRNDFSRITARFYFRIALTSANVEEVIQKRLLDKTDEGRKQLEQFFTSERESLRTLFRFGGGGKDIQFKSAEHFAASYPFIAYQYDLLQKALRGLSDHNAFTGRHVSRGERSMLEVFQHVGKELAETPLFRFASFDRMFDGIRNTLKSGLIAQINTAENELGEGAALRVLKTLLMVKYVQDFRATVDHLVVLMLESSDADTAELRAELERSLALLEHKIYIQRNGDAYEYLTNEEQDVEVEIKNTQVEYGAQRRTIAEVIFEKTLKTRKITFEANGNDYGFSRLVDDEQVSAGSGDLAIHLVTHLHPNAGDTKTVLNQAMGRKQMVVILEPDEQTAQDLRLFHQTDTWLRQQGPTEDPTRARIIAEKRAGNDRRYRRLTEQHLPALLESAQLSVYDQPVAVNSRDRRQRLLEGFQQLVTRAYPNLRMLAERYSEDRLHEILFPGDGNRLLSGEAVDVGEDEAELQMWLRRRHADAKQVVVAAVKQEFGSGQYGWPEWAVLCLIAKLFMRNAVELVSGSRVLDATEVYAELRSNRGHERLVVRPAEQIDVDTVNRLKRFHQEFFLRPAGADAGKELAIEIKKRLLELAHELEQLAQQARDFPFLAELSGHASEFARLARLEWQQLIAELTQRSDELLRIKLETVDPAIGFMKNDATREGFRNIRLYLERNAQNLRELPLDDKTRTLSDYINDPAPYLNNSPRRAREAFSEVATHVTAFVEQRRQDAGMLISAEIDKLKSSADFASLPEKEQQQILEPLIKLRDEEIAHEHLAPVIEQKAQIRARTLATEARQAALKLAHPEKKIRYATEAEKRFSFETAELCSEDDVTRYAQALERHYKKLIAAGKRVSL